MTGYIELGTLAVLTLLNSPYDRPKNQYLIPRLSYELSPAEHLFVGGSNSSRCDPISYRLWNPITASWDVHAGIRAYGHTIKLGHVSEHGIDRVVRATESMDYASWSYRLEF